MIIDHPTEKTDYHNKIKYIFFDFIFEPNFLAIPIPDLKFCCIGEAEISLSRLLIASKYIQESRRLISGKVFSIPHVKLFSSREFSEGQDSVVETKFPLCQIDLVRQVSPLESTADSRQKVGDDESFNYHLQFTQVDFCFMISYR